MTEHQNSQPLHQKKILIIGSGYMAEPIYTTLLQQRHIHTQDMTIIAGERPSLTDRDTVRANLTAAGIKHLDHLTIIPRTKIDEERVEKLAEADLMIFCAKPHKKQEAAQYAEKLKPGATFISICAGVTTEEFRKILGRDDIHIVRAMPQQPKRMMALYGKNNEAVALSISALKGLGAPYELISEKEMHLYTAHIGSGPAFIARFIESFKGVDEEDKDRQRYWAGECLTWIRNGQQLSERDKDSEYMKAIYRRCKQFYDNWLKVAREDFGSPKIGKEILNNVITATLHHMAETNAEPEDYINRVRSKRGTTNAGLLFMGSKPPQPEMLEEGVEYDFGNKQQIEVQNRIATEYATLKPEQSIVYALTASRLRSEGMEQDTEDPLAGFATLKKTATPSADVSTVTAAAQKFLPARANGK